MKLKLRLSLAIVTTETNDISNWFNQGAPLTGKVERWRSLLSLYIKKIYGDIKNLINERNSILSRDSEERKEKLEMIENEIAELGSKQIRNDILKKFKVSSQNPENINLTNKKS